ncbi:hypothetical protein Tco_1446766 [Tanacetum coccineum]
MSVRTKVGLGFDKYIGESELGWDDSEFSIFTPKSEEVKVDLYFIRFTKVMEIMQFLPPLFLWGTTFLYQTQLTVDDSNDLVKKSTALIDFVYMCQVFRTMTADSSSNASTSSVSTHASKSNLESSEGTTIQEPIIVQEETNLGTMLLTGHSVKSIVPQAVLLRSGKDINSCCLTKPVLLTPSISHFKPFGCHVTILNTNDHLGKFEWKADEGYLVGYSASFNNPGIGHEWSFDLDYLTDSLGDNRDKANQSAGTQDVSSNPAGFQDDDSDSDSDEQVDTTKDIFQQELARLKDQEQRATSDAEKLGLRFAKDAEELQKRASAKTVPPGSIPVPTGSILVPSGDTMVSPSGVPVPSGLSKSMQAEEHATRFKFQNVRILVDLPEGKYAIGTKWNYSNKESCLRGFCKIKGNQIGFSICLLTMGLMVYHLMDVKSAFLYGKHGWRMVFVTSTKGFVDSSIIPRRSTKVVQRLYMDFIKHQSACTKEISSWSIVYVDASSLDITRRPVSVVQGSKSSYYFSLEALIVTVIMGAKRMEITPGGCSFWVYVDLMAMQEGRQLWATSSTDSDTNGSRGWISEFLIVPTGSFHFSYCLTTSYCDDYHQILDFLGASHIRSPELGPSAILATIDATPYTITEDSVRGQLQLADDCGIDDLPIADIYSGIDNLGYDQFGSSIAVALIYLSDRRKFNCEGAGVLAPAVPQSKPEPIPEPMPETGNPKPFKLHHKNNKHLTYCSSSLSR